MGGHFFLLFSFLVTRLVRPTPNPSRKREGRRVSTNAIWNQFLTWQFKPLAFNLSHSAFAAASLPATACKP